MDKNLEVDITLKELNSLVNKYYRTNRKESVVLGLAEKLKLNPKEYFMSDIKHNNDIVTITLTPLNKLKENYTNIITYNIDGLFHKGYIINDELYEGTVLIFMNKFFEIYNDDKPLSYYEAEINTLYEILIIILEENSIYTYDDLSYINDNDHLYNEYPFVKVL